MEYNLGDPVLTINEKGEEVNSEGETLEAWLHRVDELLESIFDMGLGMMYDFPSYDLWSEACHPKYGAIAAFEATMSTAGGQDIFEELELILCQMAEDDYWNTFGDTAHEVNELLFPSDQED